MPGIALGIKPLQKRSMVDLIKIADDVIALEIQGLEMMRGEIASALPPIIEILSKTSGRVAVTGMGKSGHVGKKIAATLASTGTPALFVHPAEASHGDLGMITADDCILALSKSGETEELTPLLTYAKRFAIPVIAIVGRHSSSLTQNADAAFILPDAPEACGETRAPTTSTTMMMAIGDAIAVTLLRLKGFTATDFQGFHPGGNLGAALRRVSDLMHGPDDLPLCPEGVALKDAVTTLNDGGFGCVGIVNAAGELTGILTDGDLRRGFSAHDPDQSVDAIMTSNPKTVTPQTLAGDALRVLSTGKITALFAVENRKPVGLLHVHDCLAIGVL